MNYIYLIGNGFDLAHDLKTSYAHFIFDMHTRAVQTYHRSSTYKHELITVTKPQHFSNLPDVDNLPDYLNECNFRNIRCSYESNSLFSNLMTDYTRNRWVDVEYKYYQKILGIISSGNMQQIEITIKSLNDEMGNLKSYLIAYLKRIVENGVSPIPAIKEHIHTSKDIEEKNIFVNFNYTSTILKYAHTEDEVINIHGTLDDDLDEVIFGYGDEMDDQYSKIEKLNNNELLNNFKSFGYLKNSRYEKLRSFLNSQYTVVIMGHSCGISDRVLLNYIFENPNCYKIRICYHQKSAIENDYFLKTQEISRHFGTANKERMRDRIISRDQCKPLVPFLPQPEENPISLN